MTSQPVRGMLSIDELRSGIEQGEVETVLAVFTDVYGRFMGKRIDPEFFLHDTVTNGTHACDYLLTVDMDMEPMSGYDFANWERGFGDFHLVPDLSTLRIASWLNKTALIICDVVDSKTHEYVDVAPRSILRRQTYLASESGFDVFAASELEYYLFEDSYRSAWEKGYSGIVPAGWYIEDYHALQGAREERFTAVARRHLSASGIPVESSKGEWGRGQHEINVRYAKVDEMADRHVVFKQCLKEIADEKGMSVTFMAKFAEDQAGSSCHLHLSLWKDGKNAFEGGAELGTLRCSDVFKWFLGGWVAHTPEMMVFYAPTVNSYKRYQAESWAPTRLAWSVDNRTMGFRIVGHGSSLRIECRIPGADCNPYLAFAAALASGLDGIKNRIEPPPALDGDAYSAEGDDGVPRTLRVATEAFASSTFAREVLGKRVVEHYVHHFRLEQEAYDQSVSDWQRKRYFERI
jgi:glutamine synthetase